MKIDKLYYTSNSEIGKIIAEWADSHSLSTLGISPKNELDEDIDGVILFHKDYDFHKEDEELFKMVEKRNFATHRIDLNGTQTATLSNIEMWLDNNRPKGILILGDAKSAKDQNIEKYFEKLLF